MPAFLDMMRAPYRTPTKFYNERGRWRGADSILRGEIANEDPANEESYLAKEIGAYSGMNAPGLSGQIQDVRENAIRRGISTGDLGTSYEGDLLSAYDRNLKNEVGSRATSIYEGSRNRSLDLLSGERDYETAQANSRRKRGGILGKIIGGVAGSFLGPLAGAAGAKLGGRLFK